MSKLPKASLEVAEMKKFANHWLIFQIGIMLQLIIPPLYAQKLSNRNPKCFKHATIF